MAKLERPQLAAKYWDTYCPKFEWTRTEALLSPRFPRFVRPQANPARATVPVYQTARAVFLWALAAE